MTDDVQELPPATEEQLALWRAEHLRVAGLVVERDSFEWGVDDGELFVAGVDLSFPVTSATEAVATLAVVRLRGGVLSTVFSRSERVEVTTPYAASFLAFREAPVAAALFRGAPDVVRGRVQALLVDGNGLLHARAAGLACHVGVALDVPTAGVSKSLYCLDGLDEGAVRAAVAASPRAEAALVGDSGRRWGTALLTGNATSKPVFVSVGHRFAPTSAAQLVRRFCKFRVPEPIRVADLHSREALRTGKLVEVWDKEAFE